MSKEPPCVMDSWTADMLTRHPGFVGPGLLVQRSVQTHALDISDCDVEFMVQQFRRFSKHIGFDQQ
eukprot:8134132-Pyramimonas_sp.AAC.1